MRFVSIISCCIFIDPAIGGLDQLGDLFGDLGDILGGGLDIVIDIGDNIPNPFDILKSEFLSS